MTGSRSLDCSMAGRMSRTPTDATPFLPESKDLESLQRAVEGCRGCGLYRDATQAVFGEGGGSSRIVMVGEQPGDAEDRQGRPFVGPAGKLLDKALEQAGIDRTKVYLTNAVKHFKFEQRGKRRLHKKPSDSEIGACRPWLEAEISRIRPEVIVCLGATATRAVLGKQYRLTRERGKFVAHPWAPHVIATIHPSAILRAPEEDQRHAEFAQFLADLNLVRKRLERD
jgi:uracil-DNA glycosylase